MSASECLYIGGYKYYDRNLSGVLDPDVDLPIPGWLIEVYANCVAPENLVAAVYTGSGGDYLVGCLPPGVYIVREVMPLGCWVQTGPKDSASDIYSGPGAVVTACGGVYTVTLCTESACGVNFGNVCLGVCGGRTPGFWSNKNGQRIITNNWSTLTTSGALNCSVLAGLPDTNPTAPYLSSPE